MILLLLGALILGCPSLDEDAQYLSVTINNQSSQTYTINTSLIIDRELATGESTPAYVKKGERIKATSDSGIDLYKSFSYPDEVWALR
jgi:hypothetical protein